MQNSFDDESGCRESMIGDGLICHDKKHIDGQGRHRAISQDTGLPVKITDYNSGFMGTPESFNSFTTQAILIFVIIFIIIQVGAFVCWNDHYKWFSVNVTSCWENKESMS